MPDLLHPHGLYHDRPPCSSPSPEVCLNLCLLHQWCYPVMSSSDALSSSSPQSFPASGSFQMSQLFVSGGQSIGVLASAFIPSNEYSGLISFRMDWSDLLAVQGTLKSLLQHHSSKPSILRHSACFIVQLSHPYMTTGKTIALTRRTIVDKVMSLLFNMLSRLVIPFLPRSNRHFNFMTTITICIDFGAQKNSQPLFPLFPHLFVMKWWDRMPWSLLTLGLEVVYSFHRATIMEYHNLKDLDNRNVLSRSSGG